MISSSSSRCSALSLTSSSRSSLSSTRFMLLLLARPKRPLINTAQARGLSSCRLFVARERKQTVHKLRRAALGPRTMTAADRRDFGKIAPIECNPRMLLALDKRTLIWHVYVSLQLLMEDHDGA